MTGHVRDNKKRIVLCPRPLYSWLVVLFWDMTRCVFNHRKKWPFTGQHFLFMEEATKKSSTIQSKSSQRSWTWCQQRFLFKRRRNTMARVVHHDHDRYLFGVLSPRTRSLIRGWIEFLLLDNHVPSEIKRIVWDTAQNTETSQNKQAKVCGQTKITDVALSPSWGEATSTKTYPMVYTIAQHHTGNGINAFVQIFLLLKKPIWPRKKGHTSMIDSVL